MTENNTLTRIVMRFPNQYVNTVEELSALPINVAGKLVPMKALALIQIEPSIPTISRIDQQEQYNLRGRLKKEEKGQSKEFREKSEAVLAQWKKTSKLAGDVSVSFENPEKEVDEAIHQLLWALGISTVLILVTMILQLGHVMNSVLVFMAVPLGLIGVLLSLFIFKSTLSLNSLLGVILLNGIAVANSIILVDFLNRLVAASVLNSRAAALEAARTRLRPILMTSLTTTLGMLPIALGFGEGGRILQPLGIAVSGGLGVSMLLTLFIVPALQVSYLNYVQKRKDARMRTLIFFFPLILFAEVGQAQTAVTKKSFDEILNFSMSQSEDVQTKESELRFSEALLTQSKFRFAPDLNLVGSYVESGEEVDSRSVGRSYGVQSNINLFRFGADYFNYKSSDLSYESARWDLQNSRLSWEEAIAIKILDVIARHQETEIRRKLFESQRDYFQVAEKRYAKGILPRQELDKLTIDMRIAEARLKDAELAEYQAQENLKVYSGEFQLEADWPWLSLLKKISRRDFKFNVQNHPQWKFLKNKSDSADYYRLSKKSEFWPSVDLSLSYQNQMGPLTAGEWAPQWLGTVTLTIPLFNRFDNVTASRLALETQLRSELTLRKTGRELEAQWSVAERDFRVQLESAMTREQTLKISRSLYQDNLHRFQTGRSSANDLFNDQDRLYQTELLAVQGWYAAHVSYIKLCHSVGMLTAQCKL